MRRGLLRVRCLEPILPSDPIRPVMPPLTPPVPEAAARRVSGPLSDLGSEPAAAPVPRPRRTGPQRELALRAAAVFAVLCLLALGAWAYRGVGALRSSLGAQERVLESLSTLARLGAVMAEAEAALQNAAATNDPEALAPYRRAQGETQALLTTLRTALADDAPQFNRAVALGALLSQRFDAMAARLQAPHARGGATPRTADAGDDGPLHDRVLAALDEMRQAAEERLPAVRAAGGSASTWARVAIGVSTTAAIGLIGFAGLRVRRDRDAARQAQAVRRQAERAQQFSDEALQRVFDAGFEAILVIDAEGRIERAGAACEGLWGWPGSALIGRPWAELALPEDRRRIEQAAAADPAGAEFRGRCRRRDGSPIHTDWRLREFDDGGRMLALVRDASEIEALRVEAARLDTALRRGGSELEQLREQAAAQGKRLRDFMTHLGPALRSSPVAIVTLGEILQQGLAGPLNADQQRELGKLLEAARSLSARINALLDLALIEAGQLTLAREPFDVQEAIRQVCSEMGAAIGKRGLKLDSQLAASLGYARGDPTRFRQVLRVLLESALRSTATGDIRLHAGLSGTLVRIEVADSGPGLSRSEVAATFDPLRAGGAGLGLAVAQQLASLMGGQLNLSSAVGSGSCFVLTLAADDLRAG